MSKNLYILLALIVVASFLAFAGCSDDDSTTIAGNGSSDTTAISLVDVTEVIRDVSPPEFVAAAPKPAVDSFEVWTEGDFPLLSKVFGNEDPQTLYRNIEKFEMFMDIINRVVLVDENGDVLVGTFDDTVTVTENQQEMLMHVTTTVSALETATAIPTVAQAVIGASVPVDYLVSVEVDEQPNGLVQFGLRISETEQTLLVYEDGMNGEEGETETSLTYASLDPTDSTFEFKGVMYSVDEVETFSTSFIMTSEADGDFGYRMSWFSDMIPAPDYTLLGCIIGGGNKDTAFGLKYRQYTPADDASIDAEWSFDEVFGPDYTNGTGLITDYAEWVNEELILGYSTVLQDVLPSPWATH